MSSAHAVTPGLDRARAGPAVAFVAALATLLAMLAVAPTPVPAEVATRPASAASAAVDPSLEAAVAATGRAPVIVRVHPSDLDRVAALIGTSGGEVRGRLPIVDGIAAVVTQDVLAALRTDPGVVAITFDGEVTLAHDPPLGEEHGDTTFVESIRADLAHEAGYDGSGVGIAVIDTGVSPVPDLSGRLVGGVDLSGEGDGVDRYGHGTFIASLAAGDGHASKGRHAGVAPAAHVVPVKIAGANGAANISHVLAAIQYVVSFADEHDIGVLNLSLGTDSRQPNLLSPLNYAVQRAWDAGLVVVVSAGNFGELGTGHMPKPADDPLVITVGAIDGNGTRPVHDDEVAAYSSRGPSLADGIVKPDIVAPGSHLIGAKSPGSTVDVEHPEAAIRDDYMRGSGTSFAAAVVSGSAALIRQAHPDWSPDQIKGALTASARPGPVGDRNVDGHGIVDVAAAIAMSDPAPANQDVDRSSGLGSLGDARGGLATVIEDADGLVTVLDESVELTAQGQPFDALAYTTSEWTASGWYASGWYASGWYASGWYASGWYASGWYASGWYASGWY